MDSVTTLTHVARFTVFALVRLLKPTEKNLELIHLKFSSYIFPVPRTRNQWVDLKLQPIVDLITVLAYYSILGIRFFPTHIYITSHSMMSNINRMLQGFLQLLKQMTHKGASSSHRPARISLSFPLFSYFIVNERHRKIIFYHNECLYFPRHVCKTTKR